MLLIKALNSKQTLFVSLFTMIVYAGSLAVIISFHEPWFDEAQAWLIARDVTLDELFTSITHFESHPPLWYLIMMPLAKTGFGFEFGIKIINFIFITSAVGIIIFKSPFPLIIRCVLPFTYFFFYQYGVISRPYSMMLLGIVLSAMHFESRNEKPFQFILYLLLVCYSSAYGMIIASGIVTAWIIKDMKSYRYGFYLNMIHKDKRFAALMIYLINICVLAWLISPEYNALGTHVNRISTGIERTFYMLFLAPADSSISQSVCEYNSNLSINANTISAFIISILIIYTFTLISLRNGKILFFLIPYILFSFFSGFVYFAPHHLGIISMFFLFIAWTCLSEKKHNTAIFSLLNLSKFSISDQNVIRCALRFVLALFLGVSIFWSLSASYNDVKEQYDPGRELAEFIKINDLDSLYIISSWDQYVSLETGQIYENYNEIDNTTVLAYMDCNIYSNLNYGFPEKSYLTHEIDYTGVYKQVLINKGYPELLLGRVNLNGIFGDDIKLDDYSLIKNIEYSMIWKNQTINSSLPVYIRKDLLYKYPSLN